MKRVAGMLVLAAVLSFLAAGARAAEVLTNDDIVTMVKAGLGEDLIMSKIKTSRNHFDLSTGSILKLKSEGVSEKIIKTMIETSPAFVAAEAIQGQKDAIALYRQGKVAEAVAALDKLLAEKPNDDGLKIWKALALLEQARRMKDSNASGYKALVVNAYAILQPLGRGQAANPDWNFAMAKAFWLNDRPTWAMRAAKKAVGFRANFVEAQLLLGDLAYDDEVSALALPPGNPAGEIARRYAGQATRREYEKALALADVPPDLRAEALYKLGVVAADLENKKEMARDYWEKAASAAPDSRYGKMAQQRLGGQGAK